MLRTFQLSRGHPLRQEQSGAGALRWLARFDDILVSAERPGVARFGFSQVTQTAAKPIASTIGEYIVRGSMSPIGSYRETVRDIFDKNGDGIPDLIDTLACVPGSNQTWNVYLGSKDGFATTPVTWQAPMPTYGCGVRGASARDFPISTLVRLISGIQSPNVVFLRTKLFRVDLVPDKAILVEKDSYLLELSRYIHLNPVRVGEVSRAWEYAWSSAAAYVGKAVVPECLSVGDVLAHFGRRPAMARRRYAAFLADAAATTGEKPWRLVGGQVLLGERAWTERMKRRLARKPAGGDIVARKLLQPRPALSVVITQVCRAAQMDRATLLRPRGGRGGWARAAAMALAWEVGGLGQREIGRAFGVGPHAVSKAIMRTAALKREGGKVGRVLEQLTSTFKG